MRALINAKCIYLHTDHQLIPGTILIKQCTGSWGILELNAHFCLPFVERFACLENEWYSLPTCYIKLRLQLNEMECTSKLLNQMTYDIKF